MRAVWAFRLIFYPAAALASFLLLTGSKEPVPRTLYGKTEQDRLVTVHLDETGRPDSLYASAEVYCDDGASFRLRWSPSDPRIPFHVDGDELRVQQVYDGGGGFLQKYGLRAHVDADVVTGTLRMAYDACASGPVRFSARRQR